MQSDSEKLRRYGIFFLYSHNIGGYPRGEFPWIFLREIPLGYFPEENDNLIKLYSFMYK